MEGDMPLTTSLGLFIMLSATPNVNSGSLGANYVLHEIKGVFGKGHSTQTDAEANGINNNGSIAGYAANSEYQYFGYILQKGDQFTSFQVVSGHDTTASGIDRDGTTVGTTATSEDFGFIRSPTGDLTSVGYPGAKDTEFDGINENGSEIVGDYDAAQEHGLIDRGGKLITYDVPASLKAGTTFIYGVNDRREMVGAYLNDSGFHGWSKTGGVFTTIDYPGASATYVDGISNSGTLVGYYTNSGQNNVHGFILGTDGVFHEIDVTGADETIISGINDAGELVGSYYKNDVSYAFFAKPS
jgi:hypothetical protein